MGIILENEAEYFGMKDEIEALRRERDTRQMCYTELYGQWEELQRQLATMTAERDMYKQLASNCELLEDQVRTSYDIATSQAREQQLRELLTSVMTNLKKHGIRNKSIDEALALPQDDTALNTWGAKLLRDAASVACGIDAAMLNRMAEELENK